MQKIIAVIIAISTLTCSSVFADSRPEHNLKPIIGISIDNGDAPGVEASKLGMIEQVQLAGGIPLILNDRGDRSPTKDLNQIDALIVQGDMLDVDPAQYGQAKHPKTEIETDKTRTDYEDKIIAGALEKKMPLLLICGGMQRTNVLLGGNLHQNIPDLKGVKDGHGNNNGNPPDTPAFAARLVPHTTLARILGSQDSDAVASEMVNSFHHQSLDKIGHGLRVSAYSDEYIRPDGRTGYLVEAVDADPKDRFSEQFILGLQFHPELMPYNPMTAKIFKRFRDEARNFAYKNKRYHTDEEVLRKVSHEWPSPE